MSHVLDDTRFHIPILLLLCLLLYFSFLGTRDFWEHENEYAEITRVMLLDGNYSVPMVNDRIWAERPILFFWLALAFSWLAGGVSEWTMRFPSALSATTLTLVFYLFGKKRFGARTAFLSTLVLSTSLLAVHAERHIPINMVFFLFLTVSLFLFMEALVFKSGRSRDAYGAWLFMALAFLTKGPIAILLPALIVGLYLSLSRRWSRARLLRPIGGALIFTAVAAPWFALAAWKTSGAWTKAFFSPQYFWHYMRDFGHDLEPLYYFGFNFPLGFLPWTFLLVPAAFSLWPDRARLREGAALFLFLWFAVILAVSHFFEGQHGHDLFLVFLPAALAMGVYLDRLLSSAENEPLRLWTNRLVWLCSFFLIVAALASPFVATFFYGWPIHLVARLAPLAAAFAALGLWLLYALNRRHYYSVVGGLASLMVVTNILLHVFVFRTFNVQKGRRFAERMGAIVQSDDKIGVYKSTAAYKLNFYSRIKRFHPLGQSRDVKKFLEGDGPRFILAKENRANEIKQNREGTIKTVLADKIGSESWVLLYSCRHECQPVLVSVKPGIPAPVPAGSVLGPP